MEYGNLKEALGYLVQLGEEVAEPKVLEIAGKTYCNRNLTRYNTEEMASPLKAGTLTALVDYIKNSKHEMREKMIVHICGPDNVKLISALTKERKRECLFEATADTTGFTFGQYYDQEGFIINLQSSFQETEDLRLILQVAGNVENSSTANYGDDGVTQKTVIKKGIASKENVVVPNPVQLKPYRTFLEVEQPESLFVFRIKEEDRSGHPTFKLVAADGGIWKYDAVDNIKEYLEKQLGMPDYITIIG